MAGEPSFAGGDGNLRGERDLPECIDILRRHRLLEPARPKRLESPRDLYCGRHAEAAVAFDIELAFRADRVANGRHEGHGLVELQPGEPLRESGPGGFRERSRGAVGLVPAVPVRGHRVRHCATEKGVNRLAQRARQEIVAGHVERALRRREDGAGSPILVAVDALPDGFDAAWVQPSDVPFEQDRQVRDDRFITVLHRCLAESPCAICGGQPHDDEVPPGRSHLEDLKPFDHRYPLRYAGPTLAARVLRPAEVEDLLHQGPPITLACLRGKLLE